MMTMSLGTVCAVVVTCNASHTIVPTLKALTTQTRPLQHIIVVDNASHDNTRTLLKDWQAEDEQHRHVLLRGDRNLGSAQNLGFVQAKKLGAAWTLLMDHDSFADTQMLMMMEHSLSYYPHAEKLGIIAPNLLDVHSKRQSYYPVINGQFKVSRVGFSSEKVYLDAVLGVIASGSLVRMSVYDDIGGMREDFEIDYLDKEFCLRVVRAGYQIIALRDAVLCHELGQAQDHKLGKWTITTTNHSPERVYTIFRNRVRTWYAHARAIPAFMLYDVAAMCYDILRMGMFEDNTTKKLSRAWRGFWDGMGG